MTTIWLAANVDLDNALVVEEDLNIEAAYGIRTETIPRQLLETTIPEIVQSNVDENVEEFENV